jgi:ribose transport system ATP-binding protein
VTPGLALEVRSVCKRFGATQALDDVSFELARGSVHALLGGNGSGKSTLIKILAGVETADSGELEVGGEQPVSLRAMTPARARAAGLHFVHQQPSTFPALSVAENLAIGRGFEKGPGQRIRWKQVRRRAAEVLERFQIDARPQTELGELGPATQTMVAIARALQDQEGRAQGVLLLDEPTAALPDDEVRLLLDALRRYSAAGQTIVYVTHRLEEVFAVADRATVLRDGRLIETLSPDQLSHDDLIEVMLGRSLDRVHTRRGPSADRTVLELTGVSVGPLESVDLTVRAGEIVGVAGLIGSGRTSLLAGMFGHRRLRSGRIRVDGEEVTPKSPRAAMEAGFAYVPEDRASSAFSQLSVGENLSIAALDRYWRVGLLNGRAEDRDAKELMASYLIKAESANEPLSSLSGGNQQKAVLARWLRREPRVLLLDEATQGVDVGARAEIYEFARTAVDGGAVALVASSDFEELAMICDRCLVLRSGGILTELSGSALTSEELQRLSHAEVTA